jgi:predicted secreted protein
MIPGPYNVVSNMRFVAVDDNTAEGVTVLTVFIDQASNPCCATVRLEPPCP